MDGPIASAVVLPEPQELQPPLSSASPPTSQLHKRRQSSVSQENAKRPRLDGDNIGDNHQDPANDSKLAVPKRREKGRERRLFGAALGALSQNSTSTAQKRRSEIEKRQQAQRRIEEEESEQRKSERAARRKAQRWREQKQFDKESMCIRHENVLNMAHFLQTKTEPRLYYKPWETSPDEEDRIRDQIEKAHELIRREQEEYHTQQQEEAQRERHASRKGDAERDADMSQTGKESNADARQQPPTAHGSTNDSDPPPEDPDMNIMKGDHAESHVNGAVSEGHTNENDQSHDSTTRGPTADDISKEALDETGEEVLEAAEDTVIY